MSGLRILCIGEIVGKAGVFCIKTMLPRLIEEKGIDFVIANGEGATGGFGLGKNHAAYLHKLGINVITSGECIYYKRDMVSFIQEASFILRPANYPPGNPGRGWWIYTHNDRRIAVINLLGQSGFNRVHLTNPFTYLPELVNRAGKETNTVIVDFHAATTAEKYNLFHIADGSVSAVVGTHTKAQSGDETIMPGGTAIISELGRTGSMESVGGLDKKIEIEKFLTQIPQRSNDAWEDLELQGLVVEIDDNGKAQSLERIREKCEEVPGDRNSNSNRNNRS